MSELTAEKARTASLQARLEEAAARVAQFQSMLERNEVALEWDFATHFIAATGPGRNDGRVQLGGGRG